MTVPARGGGVVVDAAGAVPAAACRRPPETLFGTLPEAMSFAMAEARVGICWKRAPQVASSAMPDKGEKGVYRFMV